MAPLRIGFIGAGANTRKRHLPGFQDLENVELAAVANRTRESGEKIAEEYGLPRVHDHWRDVIADPEVDAVCIGTWPYLHCEITCAALQAGKHVLCEARMAMNVAEARQMLKTAQSTGLVAMLVPSPFGLAGDAAMREMIGDGFLGDVREIFVRHLTASMFDPADNLHWRSQSDLSGVNVLTLGILNETVQRWFGVTESVTAQTSRFIPRRYDETTGWLQDADEPDSVSVLARMAIGANAVYHVSGHAAHGGPPRIEAYGSEGSVTYDLAEDKILAAPAGQPLSEVAIAEAERGEWQVEADFVDAITTGRPVTRTNFVDGLKYMRFTEAVRMSAATGRRVSLEEV